MRRFVIGDIKIFVISGSTLIIINIKFNVCLAENHKRKLNYELFTGSCNIGENIFDLLIVKIFT